MKSRRKITMKSTNWYHKQEDRKIEMRKIQLRRIKRKNR